MKVSVITPSFKQLAWLKLCAASIADQEGVDLEHIVQDAGTGPELEEWAKSKPDIRLVSEADRGMYDAINRGFRKARGEICCYLNCDEQYLPGTLSKVAAFFDAHSEVDVLFGDAILVDINCNPLSYRRAILPQRWHTRLVHLNVLTCATFLRRSVIERGFLFDPAWKIIGDAIWVDSMLREKLPMAILPEPLSAFAFTGVNLSELSRGNDSEQSRWASAGDAPPHWLKIPLVIHHRLRKMMAGAYKPRNLDIAVYTPDSPGQRKHFPQVKLGHGWPRDGN